jgi:hypothetical protein
LEERADAVPGSLNGTLGDFTQQHFELGEYLLD